MQIVGDPLINPTAPSGIVTFELAGKVSKVQEILVSWDSHEQLFAALGLGLDYVFMLLYSTTVGLACLWAGDILHRRGLAIGGHRRSPCLGTMGCSSSGCARELCLDQAINRRRSGCLA